MEWMRRRLAFRQTAYALMAVVILASAVVAIEIAVAYQKEHGRVSDFVAQLGHAFSETSTRAAFHVDVAQADAALEGLMNFETVASSRITTDLGEQLAERSRTHAEGLLDPVSRWLFEDVAEHQIVLATASANVPVGTLSFRISPEFVGSSFLETLSTLIAGLFVEFLALASVLAIVFHRTLVRPLVRYANDIQSVEHDAVEIAPLNVPAGHEVDEFGLVVARTNGLLARLSEQREALVHREKIAALGSMLTGAAHELNNPLAVVTAQAQILRETSSDEAIIARADNILRPAERCARIVSSFLELARERKTLKAPMDMQTVIDESVELVAYQFETHDIELNVQVADDLPTVAGDAVQVSQAVVNLLINSRQALAGQPRPRTIDVGVTLESSMIVVRVRDNGPGIPEALRARVVQPFFTTKARGRGTGLGLAFCNNVAAAHGGSLTIGDGSAGGAVVTLSIAAHVVEPEAAPGPEPDAGAGCLHVLVVDDEQELAEAFAEALMLRGHRVQADFDGAAAVRHVEAERFDVVVADIRMPDVDGLDVFARATRSRPALAGRFVFVTGEPLSAEVTEFLSRHSTPCLAKPVDLAEFTRTVERRAAVQVKPS